MNQSKQKVFISYASVNEAIAEKVVNGLEKANIECFFAPRNIIPGVEYSKAIIEAIENCDVTVLIYCSCADRSGYVLREINSAVLHSKTIIPFRIENIIPSKSMEFYLGPTHWLNAFPEILDEHIETLSETIKKLEIKTNTQETKTIRHKGPIMLDSTQLHEIDYDISKMVMRTIEIDYKTVDPKQYTMNDEIEGTFDDWVSDCQNYQNKYSLLVVDDEIVGYFSFIVLNEENYQKVISGETMINSAFSEFYEFGGEFYCYIGILPILNEYANSNNYLIMLDKFFKRIVEMSENNIIFKGFGISVYTDLVEKIVERLNFKYVGDNLAKGKIFTLSIEDLLANQTIKNRYKDFYQLYKKDSDEI